MCSERVSQLTDMQAFTQRASSLGLVTPAGCELCKEPELILCIGGIHAKRASPVKAKERAGKEGDQAMGSFS
ncbi:uncharacterized [Tachysurus ichikawai]